MAQTEGCGSLGGCRPAGEWREEGGGGRLALGAPNPSGQVSSGGEGERESASRGLGTGLGGIMLVITVRCGSNFMNGAAEAREAGPDQFLDLHYEKLQLGK